MEPVFLFWRKISIFIIAGAFLAQLLWAVRMTRLSHWSIDWLAPVANTQSAIFIEHFAAGWAIPAFLWALWVVTDAWVSLGKGKYATLRSEADTLRAFFAHTAVPAILAAVWATVYLVGMCGHEAMQLILQKRRNGDGYWNHVAACLPQTEIEALSACTSQYRLSEIIQILGGGLGVVAFFAMVAFVLAASIKKLSYLVATSGASTYDR